MEVIVTKYGEASSKPIKKLTQKLSIKLARSPMTQVVLRPSKNTSRKSIEKLSKEIRKRDPKARVQLKTSIGCAECPSGKVFSSKSEMCIRADGKAAKKQGLYKKSKSVKIPKVKKMKIKTPSAEPEKDKSFLSNILNFQAPKPVPQAPKPVPQVAKPAPQVAKPAPQAPKPEPQVAKPVPQAAKPVPQAAKPVPQAPKPEPQVAKPAISNTSDFKSLCAPYFKNRMIYLHGFRDSRLTQAIKDCGGKIITTPINSRDTVVIYWKDQPKTIFTYRMMISYSEMAKKLKFSGTPFAL